MAKIVVGPFNEKGLVTYNEPFAIDDGSFPTLQNMYTQRGRLKRKRGTQFLTRLMRFFNSTISSYFTGLVPTLTGIPAINGNLLTGFGLQANGNIVPTTVTITLSGGAVYTDPAGDGTLLRNGLASTGTINYATGAFTVDVADAGQTYNTIFRYFPDLPVMGLEDLILTINDTPKCLAFDTVYSYQIDTFFPYDAHDVSFYKNPSIDPVTLPGYIPKTNWTPTSWNGQDYQQFWTVNYQGALWATNGINIPFDPVNIGMQFKSIIGIVINAVGPPAIATIQITGHGLVVGDFVFINEVVGITGINWQTGYVIAVPDANHIQVEFPNATLGGAYISGGIAQYLTNRSDITKDVLRWYDGDPTNGSSIAPTFSTGKGWVNFMPPLSQGIFSISDLPARIYYLVGARMIIPFKDRLLFIGPVVQASTGDPIYLQDTVIYSQNGTPYYTASFTGDVVAITTQFTPILVPINQTANPAAYFEDQTGFGGFIQAGYDGAITTASLNEDVLIMGLDNNTQSRFVYTGNDLLPFNFYLINQEYDSTSTFSIVNFDRYVFTKGNRGFIATSQNRCERLDIPIIDQVFEVRLSDNGNERICAQRDYINEWAYITYPDNTIGYKFPTLSLLYNYRENIWAKIIESYTTYGQFRKTTGYIWSNVGLIYETWQEWNDPWNSGESNLRQPDIIAGNQQGFVLLRDEGTGEGTSLYIQDISGNTVTSPDHCLNDGDYIVISGVIGTVASQVNGKVFSVMNADQNTFKLNPVISGGTYLGLGVITRLYVPFAQSKQFPTNWGISRKTRIGAQQYLISKTQNGQMTLLIYLSQNSSSPYNDSPIVPDINSVNDSLIYSTILFTCPESTNLGLTPANINLQMVTANQQAQIWHRLNTSLIGDTVQIGFTLSDAQMRNLAEDGSLTYQIAEIEIHGFILDVTPSMVLA